MSCFLVWGPILKNRTFYSAAVVCVCVCECMCAGVWLCAYDCIAIDSHQTVIVQLKESL
jgi:hypothetical protein